MRFLACALAVGAIALSTGCGVLSVGTGTGGQVGTTGTSASGATSTSSSGGTTSGTGGTSGVASTSSSSATASSSVGNGGSSTGTGGSGGAASASGDCATDADCPGGACVPITPGGFRVCQTPPQQATVCDNPGLDQCCAGMACPGSEPCYAGPLIPLCAGIPMAPHNQCAADQCSKDADCASGQICGLAGALGAEIRACIPAACRVDGDCAARAGGACAPVSEPCCGVSAGLYCVYPGGGCRQNADCAATQYCLITGATATCQTGSPACPQ